MPLVNYTPTPTRLVTLKEADDTVPLSAATTNVSVEQLADGVVFSAGLGDAALPRAGGTMTGAITLAAIPSCLVLPSGGSLQIQSGGAVSIASGATELVDGLLRVENTGELRLDSGTLCQLLGKTRVRAQESLNDANHNLDVNSNKNRIIMRTSPAANRVLTLLKASASPAPVAGDWFEVTVLLGTSTFSVGLQREGSGAFVGQIGDNVGTSPYGSTALTGTLWVEYDGSEWRFAGAGGVAFYGADA